VRVVRQGKSAEKKFWGWAEESQEFWVERLEGLTQTVVFVGDGENEGEDAKFALEDEPS
jgi:hypothetical protein